jgi:hypothetical protein
MVKPGQSSVFLNFFIFKNTFKTAAKTISHYVLGKECTNESEVKQMVTDLNKRIFCDIDILTDINDCSHYFV